MAGIRCSEVLEALPDYVEGALGPEAAARVEGHLAGCDWCERFGGSYGAAVAALRRSLGEPEPVPEEVRARLRAGLGGR